MLYCPPIGNNSTHITRTTQNQLNNFGAGRGTDTHKGVDFNYVGGQNGINMRHPNVHSPVTGRIVSTGQDNGWHTVSIMDSDGRIHQILHMHDLANLNVGDRINAGDYIGTMGGWGPVNNSNSYNQHVDYRIIDENGVYVDLVEL